MQNAIRGESPAVIINPLQMHKMKGIRSHVAQLFESCLAYIFFWLDIALGRAIDSDIGETIGLSKFVWNFNAVDVFMRAMARDIVFGSKNPG